MKRITLFCLTWGATIILALGWAMPAAAYSESYQNGLARHSTFHYEFTRTLVRAAGFPAESAEQIAITSAAVDLRTFTGYSGTKVRVTNTRRMGQDNQHWHFPRRGCSNSHGISYPTSASNCNTCDYFTGTSDACPSSGPELNGIDQWALYGSTAYLGAPVPSYSLNDGALNTVPTNSFTALGIFLHSLADSYSHERCMETEQLRDHTSSPSECNYNDWHLDQEFGSGDAGVPYTINAGRAVFEATLLFISLNGGGGSPLWTDEQANSFIQNYANTSDAATRAKLAIDTYNSLK